MKKHTFIFAGIMSAIVGNAFATGENVIASKGYVDTQDALKQDAITTGLVEFNGVADLPALVVTNAAGTALNGNTIGILDYETIGDDEGSLNLYSNYGGGYGAEMDNFVPTVRAVAEAENMILLEVANKQNEIIGYNAQNSIQSVLTDTTTDGVVGKKQIVTSEIVTDYGMVLDNWEGEDAAIPTVGAVAYAVERSVANAATYNAQTGALTNGNRIASIAAVDAKQNKIPARETKIDDNDQTFAPSVVTNTNEEGSVGQMAILTGARMAANELRLDEYGNIDNLIPTVGAVWKDLGYYTVLKQDTIQKSGYSYWNGSNDNTPYNNNAANDYNSWLNARVKGTGLVTRTADNGEVGERKIFESMDLSGYSALTGNNKSIADISIPTVGAMMTAIQNGVTAAAPTGTANTLVNYDANGAIGSGVATYNGSTTYNSATDSSKVAIMSAVQRKKVCAGWPDTVAVADRTDANCWLWQLPD